MLYAGIGSRTTPGSILDYMTRVAGRLAKLGYVLRSGAANGADNAFEVGACNVGGQTEIWLPWLGFNGHVDTGLYPQVKHFDKAQELHPAWHRLSKGSRALHARNVGQVLGYDLLSPVDFVLCWTEDGCENEFQRTQKTGGTATAIVLASRINIPVFNLAKKDAKDRLNLYILTI